MQRIITFIAIVVITMIIMTTDAYATEPVAGASATLTTESEEVQDYRVLRLKSYLDSHNSPLAEHAEDFVSSSDEYNLDWRFVASISGVESTFAKRMIPGTHNAYGWGGGTIEFDSWEQSIDHVSKTLKTRYVDRGAVTVQQISKIYAPPSKTWGRNVNFFMNKIDPVGLPFTLEG